MTYRFGFALTTALGNVTRTMNLRKYVERDAEVEATFAEISHWIDPDPFPKRPQVLHNLLVVRRQSEPVRSAWRQLDAVVVHGFQLFSWMSLRPRRHGFPIRVLSQDYAPFPTADMLQAYGQVATDSWRRRRRVDLEQRFTRRADLFAPWSQWAAESLIRDTGVDADRVVVTHPGVDLELWPHLPLSTPAPGEPVRVLFVGGDFVRKGGDLLLAAYRAEFRDVAELHMVTRDVPDETPPGVHIHTGLTSNDPRLRELYASCHLFVLPTRADMSSLASIEAMATGRPVITTTVGGVGEIVAGGAGLAVPPNDLRALVEAMRGLIEDPDRRAVMADAGRRRVERDYSAERTAQLLLTTLKQATDARRGGRDG